jgi:hypothetical protein
MFGAGVRERGVGGCRGASPLFDPLSVRLFPMKCFEELYAIAFSQFKSYLTIILDVFVLIYQMIMIVGVRPHCPTPAIFTVV